MLRWLCAECKDKKQGKDLAPYLRKQLLNLETVVLRLVRLPRNNESDPDAKKAWNFIHNQRNLYQKSTLHPSLVMQLEALRG